MQFKSFMEALKGDQHKIDKNKNGKIDAHDFKLLQKEEGEGEDRMARSDYKTSPSGRKSHKEIVFVGSTPKDDADKKGMKEAKMTDDDMAERERLVKGMKKDMGGFKDTYGDKAKSVMYATATKMAMKEETELDEDAGAGLAAKASKSGISIGTLRKVYNRGMAAWNSGHRPGTTPQQWGMARVNSYIGKGSGTYHGADKDLREEELDEKSDQAKQNKTMKNMMDASRGARFKLNNPVPTHTMPDGSKMTGRAHNVAIGRALRNEEDKKKDNLPFDGPYTKTKPAKNSDGTPQSPMSRARELAKQAMKKQMKEDIDRLFEKDDQEYGYEGDMAMNQLATLTRCAEMIKDTLKPDTDLPEWVQSKITLATDYITTAADYLHSELEEQAPVAPVPDKKYIRGTPEHKAYKATKKPINGMPTNTVKEQVELDEVEHKTISYSDFISNLLEYTPGPGGVTRVKGRSYGATYDDPEGADDYDDKKPTQQSAEKRGRGRPAGAKSGARKITGTSKLFK